MTDPDLIASLERLRDRGWAPNPKARHDLLDRAISELRRGERVREAVIEHKARIIAGPVNRDYPEDYEESADEQLWAALSNETPDGGSQ